VGHGSPTNVIEENVYSQVVIKLRVKEHNKIDKYRHALKQMHQMDSTVLG